ncbi:MAG: MATE family efflux transporter, partial [Prevotella sp.]
GAALATIISQMMALTWQMRFFADKTRLLHLRGGIYRLHGAIVRNIIGIGMSPFLMNVCACVVVIFINKGLLSYGGDLAVGAYGIANRVAFVFVMVVMGINQGMQPIAGYNYGAQHYDRLMRVLKFAMIAATCITTAGFLVGTLCPKACARLFTSDPQLVEMAARGITIILITYPIDGFQMVVTNFFQSIGKAKVSIFLSLSRQMLFLLPLIFLLPLRFGVDGVWFAMPSSDVIAAVVTLVIMMRFLKTWKRT